jgi:thymidylate kinase
MIILLDGSKGAGKTSVGALLIKEINDASILSLDIERRALPNKEKSRTELNTEAFEIIMEKARDLLGGGHNIIVDCGLLKERIQRFEDLSWETHTKLYKFFLKASHDTLLGRVRSRDRMHGNDTNVERFEEVYKIVHDKDFSDFIVIDTDELSAEDVARAIIKEIQRPIPGLC